MQGYEKLDDVLARAFKQASEGKGAERHANDLPFHKQPMQQIANQVGRGFILGQAIKKVVESQNLPPGRAVNELLGAINYIAGAIIHLEAKNDNEPVYAEFLKKLDDGSYLLQSLPEHAGDDPESGLIKVPEGANVAIWDSIGGGNKQLWFVRKGERYDDVYLNGKWQGAFCYPKTIVWTREPLPLTRDQAREVLAKMKRGDSVKINGFNVNFDSFGAFFVTRSDLSPSYHDQSLKATLNHIFPEAK